MIDEIDIAVERSERDLQAAIAAQVALASAEPPSIDGICSDCNGPIEPERLRALRGCTIRCAACAQHFQRSLKPRGRT
jgi:RNA polymerase-binding transcription factor DksA